MSYTFKKLGEVEALTEVPEGANALIEINGAVKRVPGSGLGGGNGIKTAIIKDSAYDNAITGVSTLVSAAPEVTYSCINMTFEEAHQTMLDGDPLSVVLMCVTEGPSIFSGASIFLSDSNFGVPCIVLIVITGSVNTKLFWTADGIFYSNTESA